MKSLAPLVVFVYNRPVHTLHLLQSLRNCRLSDQSKLFVFSDGPNADAPESEIKKINGVREIVRSEQWCKEVQLVEKKFNAGLAGSIVNGVTEIVNQFEKIIVLEDDLVLSPGFLEYLNNALDVFENESQVMHLSGYMFPVKTKLPELFFMNMTSVWGWATWKRAWNHFNPSAEDLLMKLNASGRLNEFTFNGRAPFYEHLLNNTNGKLDTWAIKWLTSVFLQHGFCLHPFPSLVRNDGNDGSGTHGSESVFNEQEIAASIRVTKIPLIENTEARKGLEQFYRKLRRKKNIIERIIDKLFAVIKLNRSYD